MHNRGANTFAAPQRCAEGAFAYDVHIGDLGNGHPDVVATNGGSSDTTVILNDAMGNLVAGQTISRGSPSPWAPPTSTKTATATSCSLTVAVAPASCSQRGRHVQRSRRTRRDRSGRHCQRRLRRRRLERQRAGQCRQHHGSGQLDGPPPTRDGTFNVAVPYTAGTTPAGLATGDLEHVIDATS
jgi:hypothetical protein